MTTHTTTADENGNFLIALESALVSGETIEITAQKDEQSKSINIQAPSQPYDPPIIIDNAVVNSPDGKFAVTTSFPNNSAISSNAAIAVNDGYGIEKDPLRFNRGASVRHANGIYYVRPNVPTGEPNINSIAMYFAIRVKRSDIFAITGTEKIIKVSDQGYYDDAGIGYPTEDAQFSDEYFLVNYSKVQFFMGVNANSNAVGDLDYLYVVVPLYFSVNNGSFGHTQHTLGETTHTLKARRKAAVFGNEFKIQLDAE